MTGNQDEVPSVADPTPTDPTPTEANAEGPSLHRTIGNVAVASAAALIFGEVVALGQTVALARLLTPAQVGLFVAGTVLTTFLGNFVEGGLRSGLIHRDKELADAADTVFWVTMIAGLLMSLATLAISPLVGLAFHNRQAGLIAAASSGVLFLYSFTNVPEALLQREFSIPTPPHRRAGSRSQLRRRGRHPRRPGLGGLEHARRPLCLLHRLGGVGLADHRLAAGSGAPVGPAMA